MVFLRLPESQGKYDYIKNIIFYKFVKYCNIERFKY